MQVTFWLWQFDNLSVNVATYSALAKYVRSIVPEEFDAGLMVKSHSGRRWQNSFDTHPLAIAGSAQLARLSDACESAGVNLGTWGECRSDDYAAGRVAAESQLTTGYYCLDLEPYKDFDLATDSLRSIAGQATLFWSGYQDGGATHNCGVSLAPLPSGIAPFGSSLRYWLLPATYLHLQCYYGSASVLSPDVAVPYIRGVLQQYNIERSIIPIFESDKWRSRLGENWPDGMDVWRL